MSLLEEKLKNNLNKKIIVATTDGMAFQGKLVAFDDVCIVLDNVLEREAKEKDTPLREPLIHLSEKEYSERIRAGSRGLGVAKLHRVTILLATISRIWDSSVEEL